MQTNPLINSQINSSLNQFENQNNTSIVQQKVPQNTSETSEKKVIKWSQIVSSGDSGKLGQNRLLPVANKTNNFVHENGIFGSYCLEDVKSIATLVLKDSKSRVDYDCFNYETVDEILNGSKKGGPSKRITLYNKNTAYLQQLANQGKISYKLHYIGKHNDLLQTSHTKINNPTDQWDKFKRRYTKNMIFFNPYLVDLPNTTKLVDAFFKYANTSLGQDGVVTMMWNPNRQDSLAGIDVIQLAKDHEFKLISTKSGKDFVDETDFVHLKNSTTLDRALSDSATGLRSSDVVSSKNSGIIYIFKREMRSSKIPAENEIATAFANLQNSI